MLLLNKKDIEKSVDLDGMMDQIEEAYKIFESGAYYMPPRPTVEHDNKTLIYMPCYTKDSLGTKMLTIFPENASLGLPSIDGLVLMNDPKTGKPLAILDGQTVTAYRTGAVGGVGIRHLSRERLPHGRELWAQAYRDFIWRSMHARREISTLSMCSITVDGT